MSMNAEIVYGFGLKIPYEPTTNDIFNIYKFVDKHKHTLLLQNNPIMQDIFRIVNKGNNFTKFTEYVLSVECAVSAQKHAYAIVSNIIALETNIRFQIDIDHKEKQAYIVFPQMYPWLCTKEEKNTNLDMLIDILFQLGTDLYLDHILIDDVRIEYFG